MKKVLAALFLVLVLVTSNVGVGMAITDGTPDGEGHPYVGLLIFDVVGKPAWRCSGTLLSPTVLLTAGHCTDGATGGRVWFESDVESKSKALGYPTGGNTSIEFAEIRTPELFPTASFVANDVGVVILAEPVILDTYGVLPAANQLDALKTKRGQ